ncbi:MAG: transglutaminase TgpA family protein [Desulfobulbaceae bacterium]
MIYPDRQTVPILGAIIACTLPHFAYISPWVTAACLLMWGYTVAATVYVWRLPGRPLLRLLAGIFFAAAMTTHEGFTIEAFIALLSLMAVLKLLEARDHRDRMITVILCYFLIAGRVFFGDSLVVTIYMLLSILFTTALLIRINQPQLSRPFLFRHAGILMLQALPIMLVFFLLFPRFQGGLWGRTHLNTAQTGFADQVGFGNIAELARNTEVAFRAEFAGEIPPRHQLYWRGIVLWDFDGRTWRRGSSRLSPLPTRAASPRDITYTITLEPHNQHWLFTLELAREIFFKQSYIQIDHTAYRWRPITSRITYQAVSDPTGASLPGKRYPKSALQLPENGNPRSRALAAELFKESENKEMYIERVLAYFRDQPFFYTLQPPPLATGSEAETGGRGANLIDRFLFESRRGFCEHYASSFAFLMRAAGLPARVVAGYQGGERNPYGDYLVVRQSDAHAWCEVWLPEKGWQRVDPTSVVAPERVTGNVTSALPPGEAGGFLSLLQTGPFGQRLRGMVNVWDFWNSRWTRWVMSYSINEQGSFFTFFGLQMKSTEELPPVLALVLGVATLVIILGFTLFFRPREPARDLLAEAWLDFCRKMERIGLPRTPAQGPLDYLEHISRRRPDLADQANALVSSYVRLRYAGKGSQNEVQALRSMLKRFHPGRHRQKA